MLTHLVATWPPRVGHLIARLLGVTAALSMFCRCPSCGTWDDEALDGAA